MFPTVTVTLCDPAAPWNNKHSSLEQRVIYSTLGEGNQRTRNVTFRRGEMQDSRFKIFICYLFVHTQELILQLLKESSQVKKTVSKVYPDPIRLGYNMKRCLFIRKRHHPYEEHLRSVDLPPAFCISAQCHWRELRDSVDRRQRPWSCH